MNEALDLPKALIFDWDNTLVDSWATICDANNHALEAFGFRPWTMEETQARAHKSMRDSYPELFGDRWEEASQVFYQRFSARHLETLTPLPGAGKMLAKMHARGIFLGVVSNKKGSYLRKEVVRLGWDHYFGRIIGAFDAERDKPARDPVDLALSGIGISAGLDVWFVGDTDIDMECAVNAGCRPVLARKTPPKVGEFDKFPPSFHLSDCPALSNLIERL